MNTQNCIKFLQKYLSSSSNFTKKSPKLRKCKCQKILPSKANVLLKNTQQGNKKQPCAGGGLFHPSHRQGRIEPKKSAQRKYKELTYDYLIELLGIENRPNNNSLSIEKAVNGFFNKFAFTGLYIYSPYMELLYKHEPANKAIGQTYKILLIILRN